MAYAFDRIMTAMGRQKKDDRPAIDSGGRQAPGQSAANPGGRTAPLQSASNPLAPAEGARAAPANDRVMASSTQAALPASGGAGGAAEPAAAQGPQQTPASRGRLFQQNAGRVGAPVDLSAMGERIAGMKGRVQQTADNYVRTAGNAYSGSLPDTVGGAIDTVSGLGPGTDTGPEADQAIANAFMVPGNYAGSEPFPIPDGLTPEQRQIFEQNNRPVSEQSWVQAYQNGPGEAGGVVLPYATDIADTDLIGTDAGIGELFRRGGGAEYTAGDAGFDTALLRRNASFNALRDQTLQQDRDLQSTARMVGETSKKDAQAALEKGYGEWKGAVGNRLSGNLDVLKGRGGERETAFDENLTSQSAKNVQNKLPKLSAAAMAELKAQNPDWTWEEGAKSVDPSSYYTPSQLTADETNWNDFLDQKEAGGWNTVMGILGREGPAYSQGQYYDKNYGDYDNPEFDSSGYAEDLINATEGLPKLVTESGKVDYTKIPPPVPVTRSPSGGPPPAKASPTGTVNIDFGEGEPQPLDGYTPIDENSVEPVGARPGQASVDIEGSENAPPGEGLGDPWWVKEHPFNPEIGLPTPIVKKFPKIRAQMGR